MRNIYVNYFKSSSNMRIIINLLYKEVYNIYINYKRKIFEDIKSQYKMISYHLSNISL